MKPLTREAFEKAKENWLRRMEADARYRAENPKLRMMLSDAQKRAHVRLGIDPAEAYDLVEPITLSELTENNPLDDSVIE